METEFCLAYITAESVEEARRLGKLILEQKLAGCINLFPRMESIYYWEGKLETSVEVVLLAKTQTKNQPALLTLIEKEHKYEIPCVLFLPIQNGSPAYLKWLTSF